MWRFKVVFSLLCFAFTIKAAKVNTVYDGSYEVYAKSASFRRGDECIIKINKGPNLCQNKRGHNIVVIDPQTDEFESVRFDTYGSKLEARRMVDYLKGVKMNSVIIMAIRDSSRLKHWEQDWIDYVDGYGSKTLRNPANLGYGWLDLTLEPLYIGCPFILFRRSWALVTQKLPIVNGKRQLPAWKECKYDRDAVEIHTKANIQTHCFNPDRQMTKCYNKVGSDRYLRTLESYTNKLETGQCFEAAKCRHNYWCDPRYSVSENLQVNYCQRNGSWPVDFKCPTCKSKFGIDKLTDSEKVYFAPGETKSIRFKFQTVVKPEEGFTFYIIFNKTNVAAFNPYTNKPVHVPTPGLKNVLNHSEHYSHKKITNEIHEYTMSWTIYNARMSYNNYKLSFLVTDIKNNNPIVVLHNYNKIIKVEDPCKNKLCPGPYDCVWTTYENSYCKLNRDLKRQHEYCSAEKTTCSRDHTQICKILDNYPFYECVCEENYFGDSCETTFRTMSENEIVSKSVNFRQDSVFNYANFSYIQNMKMNFSKLSLVNKRSGVYNLHNVSVEFPVEYLNKTNNKSSVITVKSVTTDYYIFTKTKGKDFYMCAARSLVKFYSDDIENSLTTAIQDEFSMEAVVCEAVFRSTTPDPCIKNCENTSKCTYIAQSPYFQCINNKEQ